MRGDSSGGKIAGAMLRLVLALLLAMFVRVAAAQAPVAALPLGQWTKFIDPNEGSFSMEVPAGWRISGGLARRNALQMWPWLSAVSPDGNTVLAFGDPTLQSYTLPNPMLAMAGFREGSLYNGGGGTLYVVSRYRSGQEFAAGYGQQALPRLCTEIRMAGARDRPDIGAQFSGGGASTTVGEARFTCRKGDMPMEAYVFCATSLFMMPPPAQGAGLWYPSFLYGFLAPQKLTGIAAGVTAHMLTSIEINPQWVAWQSETNMAVSRIATATGHAMSNTIMQGWEERGAAIDRVMEEGSRARLGIDIYSDPATGNRYTVENTHRYYWVNPQGSVVGTDTETPPAGFERLQRVPPSH